jgi:adenylate cyclase class 2
MAHETEVKFKVADFAAVRRRLRRAAATYLATALQTDAYFDTPDRALRREDRGLRIRSVRHLRSAAPREDARPLVTYKGPGNGSRRAKVRREVQTRVDDANAAAEILAACGLEMTVSVQKRRASYRLGDCRVELDELPGIGRFVEIEGPGERAIHAAAEVLGLGGRPITDHYVDLLEAHRRRPGADRRRVHFD